MLSLRLGLAGSIFVLGWALDELVLILARA